MMLVATAAVAIRAAALPAQTVTRDPITGDYVVHYLLDGSAREVHIVARDRVNPSIDLLSVQATQTGLRYTYLVANHPGGQALMGRGFRMMDLDCADDAASANSHNIQPPGWRMSANTPEGHSPVCMFRGAHSLEPGDSVSGLTITSVTLPRIGTAEIYGKGDIPVVEDEVVPDSVSKLLAALTVRGLLVSAVVPGRPLSEVASPISAVAALRTDLRAACGLLGWIDNPGVCRSLNTKLDATSASIARGQTAPARNQLAAFDAELDAQRGHHVSDNAYSLLRAMSDHALRLLP